VAASPAIAQEAPAVGRLPAETPGTSFRAPMPNPASRSGELQFTLREPGRVEIVLYSVQGRLVRDLGSGWYGAGEHRVAWRRDDGGSLSSGVYFVRFRGDGLVRTQKLILLP
jgi:hypothetical protein